MKQYIGIEIGGTKQQVAAFDENGTLLKLCSERVPIINGASDILAWIEKTVSPLICADTVAIGVGFGGIIETHSGKSYCSVQVKGWADFQLKTWFEEKFGLPATIVNDTVCGGYAEVLFGAGAGADSFFYTNIGTGCGGAMFMRGRNFDGIGTGSSYLGQVFVPSWEKPNVPVRMEQICSGVSVERRLRTAGYVPDGSMLYGMCGGDVSKLTCREWATAAKNGDAFAKADIEKWAESYAVALSNFIVLYSPRIIAIGGGVSNCGATVLEPIKRHTDELCFISMKNKYDIVQCKTGDMAVLIGAAMYARDGFTVV